MTRFIFTLVFCLIYICLTQQNVPAAGQPLPSCDSCLQFERLNTQIRDRKISRSEALKRLRMLLPEIKSYAITNGCREYRPEETVFPLKGYDVVSARNRLGADYKPGGYDFFDGNRHGGHPSFDLFIRDRNQDSVDDSTGRQVSVVSMTGGIVVAAESEWDRSSRLRGGKYIWIYDIYNEALIYYAHNDALMVKTGEIVTPGQVIAMVGRTGLNAYKRRSPTHLHLTCLRITNDYPRPVNIFRTLQQARRLPAAINPD